VCGLEARRVSEIMTDKLRKLIGCILLVSFVFIGFFPPIAHVIKLPTSIVLMEGQEHSIPVSVAVEAKSNNENLVINKDEDTISLNAQHSGDSDVILELAGIPIKKVNVNVLKDFKVIPGGQSIGVKLNTVGVLVVGHHQIETANGKVSPGEDAGIKVGDLITKINGKEITSMNEIAPMVQEAGQNGQTLKVDVQRDQENLQTELKPAQEDGDDTFKLGLYIRDSAMGIGTMTFYEPKSKKYGALGHVISDMDTKKPIVVKNGQIVRSTVTSINKGSNGTPGEKLARFSENKEVIGNITNNSQFGIFGTLKKDIKNNVFDKPMPIALSHQVKEGPAKILTVVDDDQVELFDIEIVSTTPQKFPATKGMVIKVTDERLLEKTGGIVQGMSGSPIIQDGKVIGAVTHVFVNDPTSGYGVHIEWMLNEAGLDIYEKEKAS